MEFRVHTSYKPNSRAALLVTNRVFPIALWPKHEARGHISGSVIYSTDREEEVSKIFTIPPPCVCLLGSGTISIHAEPLQISDARQNQSESISNRW